MNIEILTRIFLFLGDRLKTFVIIEGFILPPAKVILTVQGKMDYLIFKAKKPSK